MKKEQKYNWLYGLVISVFLFSSPVKAADLPSITVLASSSLSEALIEITREYSRKKHVIVNLQFSTSLEFVEQIEDGASADLFISADPELVKRLKNQGLIDVYSQTNLVENKLALIARSDNDITFGEDTDLKAFLLENGEKRKLTMADSFHTALGQRSKEILEKLLGDKYYKMPVLYVSNPNWIKEIVVEKNKIGITYFSDTIDNPDIKLLTIIEDAKPVLYQAAVVAGENMSPAREYLNYIKSDTTKEVFEKYGFIKK